MTTFEAENVDMVVTILTEAMVVTTRIMEEETTNIIIKLDQILAINNIWITEVEAVVVVVKEGMTNLMLNATYVTSVAIMLVSADRRRIIRGLLVHKKLKMMETMPS